MKSAGVVKVSNFVTPNVPSLKTYAQRAARALERSGIGTGVLKAPAGLTGNGCSYCVAVSAAKGQRAVNILRSENLLQGKVFLQKSDNSTEEVRL